MIIMGILVLDVYGMLGHKLFQKLSRQFDTFGTCRSIRKELSDTVSSNRLLLNVIAKKFYRQSPLTIGTSKVFNIWSGTRINILRNKNKWV